ncbi:MULTISPECIES: hypothetical protein [Yersinia pseudotuberculosis complex]|uniref:Lipoprotein n=1 Tax=Yersinia pseudotuberculosis serotype O:1b (strain IP 31758) TaxID=349747 RepID=A0A0U1R288_YERP3|nr:MULTISPECIES: hypothetical protein [Yersinia pseudotuberculosis complex]ABS49363.1 hypothetical protein YpsIP31758_1448 [Yersinia pseudotuberculosis IP 31758]AIN15323.1 putative exported protein [Yersinia pseudotuberculosis]AJJ06891.1 hypothetical protein BZ20_3618 [Yersinia pseudotuberculosis]AJK17185.1 hypothetical protein BZ19_1952 [Yersinia pseudotuberculosis str. PA3606]MBO1554772.1 hypothetical protein [Yersinia pseudotuberculosis]
MKLSLISTVCIAVLAGSMQAGYVHAMTAEQFLAENKKLVEEKKRAECRKRVIENRNSFVGSVSIVDPISVLREDIARHNC